MTRVEHSVVIQAPVEDVFAYASDWRRWHEWFEGVSEFTPTTETTEGNGARYAYKAQMMGMWASVETEIQSFEQNRGWTGVGTKGVSSQTHWSFEPLGTGTKFTYAL